MSERFSSPEQAAVIEIKNYFDTNTEQGRRALLHQFWHEHGDKIQTFPDGARHQVERQMEVYAKGQLEPGIEAHLATLDDAARHKARREMLDEPHDYETFEFVYDEVQEDVDSGNERKLQYYEDERRRYEAEPNGRKAVEREMAMRALHADDDAPTTKLRLVANNSAPIEATPPAAQLRVVSGEVSDFPSETPPPVV